MRNFEDKIVYYTGQEALSYSDVYILPTYSDIRSRHGKEISTSTKIARGVPDLKIPLVSAGMDTVTEDDMAITMALNGGIGEIHRNNTPHKQADLVRRVKERVRLMEKNPPMVSESATIADALNLLEYRQRGYVIVHPGDKFTGIISGIATSRDFLVAAPNTKITEVMTPATIKNGRKLISVPEGTTLEEAVKIMLKNRIEKVPVMDLNNKLAGVYTVKDFEFLGKYPTAAVDVQGRLMTGAAIGVHDIDVTRALLLVEAGVDVLFLDIAHGHSIYTKEMIHKLKDVEKIKVPIIAGNFATAEGVLFAYECGVDGIKIGIGPGYVCKTRNVAGTGVPQVTAIMEAKKVLDGRKDTPPIIADGGIREPGDCAKALACGADTVMMGSLLAGTDRSPGEVVRINGIMQKQVRGMASSSVFESRIKLGDSTSDPQMYTPEGRETFTPYQGSTQKLLSEYLGGLRSAMSYAGAHNIKELQLTKLIHLSSKGGEENNRALS